MPNEPRLREQARSPDQIRGGPIVDAPCSVCGRLVIKAELEFELQWAGDGASRGLDKFHIHTRCFAAWEFDAERGLAPPAHDAAP